MHKKLFIALIILIGLKANAQLDMTIQVPAAGIILKTQLWNFLVVNGSASSEQIKISLQMTDAVTHEPVLNATSNAVQVNNGSVVLLSTNLDPIEYEYLSSRIVDHDPNGFLPIGNFQICYTISRYVHIGFENVSEECINVNVEPLSPPLLNTPFDGSTDETSNPQFSWLPPAPLNMFYNVTYDLMLVEVQEGQTAAEAIQQNMPVFSNSNNPDIFINYPSSNTPLDTAKLYAWQITANSNNQFAAQSEVWTFRIKGDSIINQSIDTLPYVKLKKELDASVSTCKGILKLMYTNAAFDSTLSYTINSLEESDLGTVMDEGVLSLTAGDNYIDIPFLNDNRLIDQHTYLFIFTNSRNEHWMMKFIYRTPE